MWRLSRSTLAMSGICQESVKGSLHSLHQLTTVMRKCARRSGKRWSPTASARTTAKPPKPPVRARTAPRQSGRGARTARGADGEGGTGSPPRARRPPRRVARLARRSRDGDAWVSRARAAVRLAGVLRVYPLAALRSAKSLGRMTMSLWKLGEADRRARRSRREHLGEARAGSCASRRGAPRALAALRSEPPRCPVFHRLLGRCCLLATMHLTRPA